MSSDVGLVGLAVMGQNFALNMAEHGFTVSVYNRTASKTDETVARARAEGGLPLVGHADMKAFVASLKRPRRVVILVKAGKPVDETIEQLKQHLEAGDLIVDGGNEWYENTERRQAAASAAGLLYMGMGVSGGESGARHGPSLMPGGPAAGWQLMKPILEKCAAQVDSGPCVTYIGPGGAGNYVKMVHNGIEYGDMQIISEAYSILRNVGQLSNAELAATFKAWDQGEMKSFLVEITGKIFTVKDPLGAGELVDKVLDKTGMKGTGKWTVQEAAEQSVACPVIASALDARFLSGLKDERVAAAPLFTWEGQPPAIGRGALVDLVRQAMYASKICSYAQGMNLIRAAGEAKAWHLNLGEIARIWKGGCIIRAIFLDRIKQAYDRNPHLASLLIDAEFAAELQQRQGAWRKVVVLAVEHGIPVPAMSAALSYFDAYRSARLPANLLQAQRDFFGAHTYERTDQIGGAGPFHTEWETLAQE